MLITKEEFLSVKQEINKSKVHKKNYLAETGTLQYLKYRLIRPFLKAEYSKFRKNNPELPWVNKDAIKVFHKLLKKNMNGIEYGSGISSIFFSKQLNSLNTIEHNKEWHNHVEQIIIEHNIKNIKLNLIPADEPFEDPKLSSYEQFKMSKEDYPVPDLTFKLYSDFIKKFEDESLDFVLIDGRARVTSALNSIPKIKKGGILVLDNSERNRYQDIHSTLKNWPSIFTTSGLSDTTFWLKTE
ncbi:hypothetical protein EV198_2114 [Roseivirga ehrenbergii]|uniref:Methyltransferase n=1 Tax=Roseivirga ehrenbergii (strain DSM 102268 / JCM 13514 / KCTC 12282 / NCIMB 14502 / KMM 6017) TaxID=279360 RepID=A0A150WYS1_ROSEK|nr:hypothetical protein [Roseivirga ehrenbergii]KYG71630.1 hypothetical protein MB14_09940 [Roseivirga ehrenbergii]TCL07681.1 hypothetical protein EV198_2114 [Roseivirga ehrenbergii]